MLDTRFTISSLRKAAPNPSMHQHRTTHVKLHANDRPLVELLCRFDTAKTRTTETDKMPLQILCEQQRPSVIIPHHRPRVGV